MTTIKSIAEAIYFCFFITFFTIAAYGYISWLWVKYCYKNPVKGFLYTMLVIGVGSCYIDSAHYEGCMRVPHLEECLKYGFLEE